MRNKTPGNAIHVVPIAVPASCESAAEGPSEPISQDPWIAIWSNELQRAFRDFSRESGRLSRLAQRKRKVTIPSEAFNQMLADRLELVERAFDLYIRRKEELLTYIAATSRRSEVVIPEDAADQRVQPRAS